MSGEGGNRILAAPVDQILGEAPLLLGNRRIALQPLGVDDRVVEARLDAVVKEDAVEHLTPRRRQAERDVGDPQDRPALGEALLDRLDPLDGRQRRADVVDVARPHGKDQRVEDQVPGRDAVLPGQQRVRALGDRQLAGAGHCHALLLVLVDAADDDSAAVAAQERRDLLEPLLAVLQVDRVDDRLALTVPQRDLQHGGVGRVDHQRHLDAPRELAHEAVHVGRLVAVGIGEADVEHLGAGLDLGPAHLGGVVEALSHHQLLELA